MQKLPQADFTYIRNYFSQNKNTFTKMVYVKVGMQFAQPATRCRICLWKSQGTPFRALTILERSRISIYGLAAQMLALNTLRNFDGRQASFAQVAEKSLTSHP